MKFLKIFFPCLILVVGVVISSCRQSAKNESVSEEIVTLIENLDQHYDSLYFFLSGCYDAEKGGFYEFIGASGEPKLESTARAITMLEKAEMLSEMPAGMKLSIIKYLQNMQNPETGFFEDLQEKRDPENRRGRAFGYSVNTLGKLGAEPLYPLPTTESKVGVEHIQSAGVFVNWMQNLDWDKPWKAGAAISSQSILIKNLPDSLKNAIIDAAFDWLAENQDAETGWWGNDSPYQMLSGAFKLSNFYQAFSRPMPNADKIYQSILKVLREEQCSDGCWVRNPLHLLNVIKPGYENISVMEKEEIIRISIRNILNLERKDGGFAQNTHQKYSVTDGCSQAMKTRDAVRKLAGLTNKPFPNGDLFFKEK